MTTRFQIGLFAVLLLFVPEARGQTNAVQFEHINLQQGLSQGSVYCMAQDRNGFLWFGTQDGLNKYDGYHFTVYRHSKSDSNSLSDNFINAIKQDDKGFLWVGTLSGGLNRFDPRTNIFKSFQFQPKDSTSISSNTILSIFQDHRGTMWIGTDNGLNQLSGENFIKFNHDPLDAGSISGNIITSIYEDSNLNLWIGTTKGLNLYDRVKNNFHQYVSMEKFVQKVSHITALYEDKNKNLLVGTNGGGLFQALSTGGTHIEFKTISFRGLLRNEISSILSDPLGNVWIGFHEEGLIQWDPSTGEHRVIRTNPVQPNSLSNDRVSSLYFDKFGDLWVGTLNGINKLNLTNQKFLLNQNVPGISGDIRNSIFAIAKDAKGNIWTGTRGGLFCLTKDLQLNGYKHLADRTIKEDAIRSIYIDKKGQVLVGTEKGTLEVFDPSKKTFRALKIDENQNGNQIYVIREDTDGTLWLGTLEGLYHMDVTSGKTKHFDWQSSIQTPTKIKEIRSIEIADNGDLLIGTRGAGLFILDKQTGVFANFQNDPKDPFSLSHNVVASIYIDKLNSGIWLGTASGFNKFSPGEKKFYHYTEENGLPNDVVYGILPDDEGYLWLSTNNGLAKFDPKQGTFRNYDITDGLQSSEFNAGAYYRSDDKEMFFGGINGYNSFRPENIKDNTQLPQVVLTGFKVFNEEVPLDTASEYLKNIELSYADYVFSLEFTGLHLTAPEKNKYAYMLEGFDEDWVYTQRRFATYTNLDPGRYTFRVKASNNDGIWNEAGLSINIVIRPPLWQAWWFYTLVAMAVAGFIYALYKFRVNQIRKEEELKTEFNKKLAEVEMTALRAQMNPHFLFNCLNSINRFIVQNDPETASEYLTKFSRLIRLILNNSKSSGITLKSELEALRLYIEMEKMRFENHFEYFIHIDQAIEIDFVEVPPLLLQPYVENAIWHGLMHKESSGKLTIDLTKENGLLRCVIEDNGIGRKKAELLKSKSATRDKSMGMKITTDRLNLYQKQTSVEIVDLADSNGNSCGTRVLLGIPYSLES